MPGPAPLVVVMGVAGAGKSTIGRRVADRLGLAFVDGDDAHSAAAKAQMHRAVPLTEAQRGPWLDRLHQILVEGARGDGVVLACSALTAASRRRLAGDLPVRFVALVAPEEVLAERLATRTGHFAGPSLLTSQLTTLELDAGDVTVDATRPRDDVVEAVVRSVTG